MYIVQFNCWLTATCRFDHTTGDVTTHVRYSILILYEQKTFQRLRWIVRLRLKLWYTKTDKNIRKNSFTPTCFPSLRNHM